ncbi:MAG: glycosyltransferase [Candidatus Cloacimonadota bacterium]|nr:glycosyltransferase [Candidatus Cloacimonadota bacterium]
MSTFTIIALSALFVYVYYLIRFYIGIQNHSQVISYNQPTVSVVIAARNEEKNIAFLLTALANQTYSEKLYEVIIVNDASTDKTEQIVQQFTKKWNNFSLINITKREGIRSPKKNALQLGISSAKGEIILSTDADCMISQYWIESMIANFTEGVAMVSGFSQTKLKNWQESKLVQKYEHFDFLVLMTAAAGATSAGKYFSSSGQNIGYRKDAFEKVGGFEKIKHLISGDDVNLMQLFRKAGYKMRFSFFKHSFVQTLPAKSWKQFLNQRIRWASNFKWQLLLNVEFFFYLASFILITLLPWVALFIKWQLALILFLARILVDVFYLLISFRILQIPRFKLKMYILWFLLQPVYIIIAAIGGQLEIFRWKT